MTLSSLQRPPAAAALSMYPGRALTPALEARRIPPRVAISVSAVAAGAGIGLTLLLGLVGKSSVEEASLSTATGTGRAVLAAVCAALLVRRLAGGGSALDAVLTATLTLVALLQLSFVVVIGLSGVGPLDPVLRAGFALTEVVVAAGFAGAVMQAGRPVSGLRRLADRLFVAGSATAALVCLAAVTMLYELFERRAESHDVALAIVVVSSIIAATLLAGGCIAAVRNRAHWHSRLMPYLALTVGLLSAAELNVAAMPWLPAQPIGADLLSVLALVPLLVASLREFDVREIEAAEAAVGLERRRLARELHDGLAQELVLLKAEARRLGELTGRPATDEVVLTAERAIEEARAAINALTRAPDEPFDSALRSMVSSLAERVGLEVEVSGGCDFAVTAAAHQSLLRVVREALLNAARHGQARRVHVLLSGPQPLLMRIADDGIGFDPSVSPRDDSYGLLSMRERVENLGGRFHVHTAPGAGTTITVVIG